MSYVAALATDDFYSVIQTLEAEERKGGHFDFFFANYIPSQKYMTKLERAGKKLQRHLIFVLWWFGY